MKIDIIDNIETFESIKNNWDYVYNSDRQAQFFVSSIWISATLKIYSKYKISWVILAAKLSSDASEYVGFFPLMIKLKEDNEGNFYTQLSMLGVTDGDYPGFLGLPEYEKEIISAFAEYLQQEATWLEFEIENIQKTDTRLNLFLKSFPQESFYSEEIDPSHYTDPLDNINNQIIPYVTLPDSWEEYLQKVLSSNTRQKIRRFFRKIEDSNEFYITDVNADNLERHLKILTEFWRSSWESRKGAERCKLIVERMSFELRHCFENNCLYLPVLWKGDKPIGAIANLIDFKKKTLLFFAAGRDETVKDLPSGFVLHAYAIQYGIKNGFKIYNFLMGNEAYKYSFGAKECYIQTIMIQRKKSINQKKYIDIRNIPHALEISTHYHRANRLIEAQKGYRQILELQPKHPEALYGLSVVMQRQGNYESAETLLLSLLQVQPNNTKAWFSLGTLYQIQNHLPEAEKTYQYALTLQPESPSQSISFALYHNLGYTLQQQKKWEEAIACFQKARELKPDCIEAEVMWANALYAQGKLSKEQQAHYAAVNKDLGTKRKEAGDLKVAIEYYRQSLLMNPELAETHYHLGLALQKHSQNNSEEAIACFQKALSLKPDYIEAEVMLANLLYAQGKLSKEKQAHYALANYELGNKSEQARDLKKAIEYYHQAIAMNRELADAHYHLGLVLHQLSQKDWEEARISYQTALELKPGFIEAEVMLANLLHAQGKLSKEKQAHYAVVNYELGNKCKQTGNLKNAIDYYHLAITMNPELADARENLKLALQEQENIKIKVSCAKQ